jgi:3-isopropylmalate dehydrogenase
MTNLHKKEGNGVDMHHMYADNCAMQLVKDPKQFDVIVTDNLFGDILSDCAAMLTGSLGMLPSASLGSVDKNTGKRYAMYEPVHGSAPDIAGKGLANPLAELLSLSMLLRYSFNMEDEADLVDEAVSRALDAGPRTPDIMADGREKVGTKGMMDLVINKLEELTK